MTSYTMLSVKPTASDLDDFSIARVRKSRPEHAIRFPGRSNDDPDVDQRTDSAASVGPRSSTSGRRASIAMRGSMQEPDQTRRASIAQRASIRGSLEVTKTTLFKDSRTVFDEDK